MGTTSRRFAVGGIVAALLVLGTGVAMAGISGGNYSPARQHCSGHADDYNRDNTAEPECRSLIGSVSDGSGNGEVSYGERQTTDGNNVDPSNPITDTDPSGFDPTTGFRLYFGADDNLDSGEHDSSSKIGDGPSDGGAIELNVLPQSLQTWIAGLQSGGATFLLTHPIPIVDAGFGSCADGLCESVQTQKRMAYKGGSKHGAARDAANYEGHRWDPESCGGPSDGHAYDPATGTSTKTTDCNDPNRPNKYRDITYWHNQSGDVYVEPGVQVYEDPNPEGSPIAAYPVPAAYAGTCGVILGGGVVAVPASPLTNGAGQLVIPTQC